MSHCLVSFRGLDAPRWVLDGIADGRVPGVCLFAFNFRDFEQFAALTASLLDAARAGGQPPPLVGIDQEGGQLMAIGGGATELPGNMALGAARSTTLAKAAGRILGRELGALGCNLNFAPVLDLATRPQNPVVGLRAFGDEPELVARLGIAMITGMQAEGVMACAKHFPGHGNTLADSHHTAATVKRSLPQLKALELRPFEAAFAAGLKAVMTAHVRYPSLDDEPATFSRVVLHDLLRKQLGFDGLVITDALDMHALAAVAPELRARRALEAGADLAILGHIPDQEAIVDELAEASFPDAKRRIDEVRATLAVTASTSGERRREPVRRVWPQHAREAKSMANAAITVVSGAGRLPLRPDPEQRLCVVTVAAGNLTPAETVGGAASHLADQVARRHADTRAVEFAYSGPGSDADASAATEASIATVLAATSGADTVILATVDAAVDHAQQALFTALKEQGHEPVLLALRSPVDVAVFAGTRASLCSYGRRETQTEAAVAVMFGERPATGLLPVALTRRPAAPATVVA